ncbi:multiple epidermal growth factor-like domains protein 10 [Gigantopelta aegis]|uniref:multiple epidermal growth factor-like domains protein 10 n=1 Tax=Gigantopelta aegis TaxID=1735272 RepID=UPI001B88B524|nr:multiple epidermal growth factor-like domains protein 10 [Gigantopelta aegis]
MSQLNHQDPVIQHYEMHLTVNKKKPDCTKVCLSGKYGYNCNVSCEERKCSGNSTCDRNNGECVNGCLKGWELPDCITECRHHTFGSSCLFSCTERHCKGDKSSCDVQDGVCQDGCQPGWTNANCTEKCDDSSYGPGCVFKCYRRHCLNKAVSCNRLDGSCGGECENNYNGIDCTAATGPENNRDSITIIALAVVAAILFVLLIVSVLWHFRSRNSQRNNVARQFISSTSPDRTEAEPSGVDSGSGYVNAGQTNEYEQLDVLNSPQNDYDKITGV